jgi:hypothetical protein
MLPATFFVRQDVFISKDTSCQESRCKEGCKITSFLGGLGTIFEVIPHFRVS